MFESANQVEEYLDSPTCDFSFMGEAVAFYQKNGKPPELLSKLVVANDKLVRSRVARIKVSNSKEDAYQDGCEGLLLAIDRYDISLGKRFSTFATPYIDGYIKCGYHNSNPYGIPRRDSEFLLKVKKEIGSDSQEASLEQIANIADISIQKAEELRPLLANGLASLDVCYGENGDGETIGNIISDNSDFVGDITTEDTRQIIRDVVKIATANASQKCDSNILYQMVAMRFGFDGKPPATLQEVADKFGISRRLANAYISHVIRILRSPKYQAMLRNKLEVPFDTDKRDIPEYVFSS